MFSSGLVRAGMSGEPEPGESGKPARKQQTKLTADDRAKIEELCRRPDIRKENGELDVPAIARISGATYQQVIGVVRKNKYLHAQVAEVNPDSVKATEADLIDGELPPGGIFITDDQLKEYQALIRQNKRMMAKDWQGLGMTEEAGQRFEHYGTIGTAPTGQILRMMTGMMISNLYLLDRVNKQDAEMILSGKIPAELSATGEPRSVEVVAREWRITLQKGFKLQLDMYSYAHKMQALMASVMANLRKMNGGQAPTPTGTYDTNVSERAP